MLTLVLIILVVGFAVALLFNLFYVFVVRYNDQEEEIRRGRRAKNKYEIVAFGSSYCRYAFDFSETGKEGYNFGIVAQFLYYTDLMIRSFRKSYKDNSLILIVLPDLVFAEPGKGKYGASRYVRFIDREMLKDEFSYKNLIFSKYLPLFLPSPHHLKYCLKRIAGFTWKNEYRTLTHNQLTAEEVDLQARQRCEDWCKEFKLENTTTANIPIELQEKFKLSVKILEGTIDYCLREGLRPALVVTPVSDIMHKHLSMAFLEKVLYSNIREANKKGIPVFDYYMDERFMDPDLYANNADLLNARGRKLFSNILVEDLKKYYD